MSKLIALKIDVSKINKERLYHGQKGVYAELVVEIKDQADDYGNNVSAWEGQTKDERIAKQPRNFLGNGKVIWEGESKVQEPQNELPTDDDLPW